ncbi:MAG: hypothetical protein ACRDK5_08585 [Solirubrobacterales bacterium]
MSEGHQAEELAAQVADTVRRTVAEAEAKAEQIVRDAEVEAKRIRDEAEGEAREGIERARRALNELAGETPRAAPDPDPERAPEPQPEPSLPASPAPDPQPPPQESSTGGANGDDAAARLVAMKLAIDGKGREEIEAELTERFGPGERSGLLDDVLARAGR